MFTNKKREDIGKFVCAFSLYVAETPKASIKDHKPPLSLIPFGIVAYGFVGQPFSKQLYLTQGVLTTQVHLGTVGEGVADPASLQINHT